MKVSVIDSKFVISNLRFDGKYHLSEGLTVRKQITKSPYGVCKIEDVTSSIYCPGIFHRNYTKSGTPFLGGGDIQKSDLDSGKYLRKKTTPNHEILAVQKGWTLVTCGGTIGCTVFANELLAKCWVSQHVMRVISSKIKEGMLFAYLASKQGHSLLTTNTYGSVIPTLNAGNIASIPIPLFNENFQIEVDNMVQLSAKLKEEAYDNLNEAKTLFEKSINNKAIDLGYKIGVVSSRSIASRFLRFDSQYQLGLSQLKERKANSKTTKIKDYALKIFVGNRGKRCYVEKNGIPFLSSSDMMLASPLRFAKQISKKTPNVDDMIVHKDDILISRSGTVGNTIIVGEKLDGVAVSEHAMRLVIDKTKISPKYVFAYFMTQQGQDSLHILPYGSVIVTLGEEFLADLDLPILSDDLQSKIVSLIETYIDKNDSAVELEERAISLVEQEIETWNN